MKWLFDFFKKKKKPQTKEKKAEDMSLKETIDLYTSTQDPEGDMFFFFGNQLHTLKKPK